jgi:prevent-host-death family protein
MQPRKRKTEKNLHRWCFSAKDVRGFKPLRGAVEVFRSCILTIQPAQTRFFSMKVVNVQEAKTHLSRLIEEAVAGEPILLAKHGKPLVRLSAYIPGKEERPLGGFEGRIRIAEDFDAQDSRVEELFYDQ